MRPTPTWLGNRFGSCMKICSHWCAPGSRQKRKLLNTLVPTGHGSYGDRHESGLVACCCGKRERPNHNRKGVSRFTNAVTRAVVVCPPRRKSIQLCRDKTDLITECFPFSTNRIARASCCMKSGTVYSETLFTCTTQEYSNIIGLRRLAWSATTIKQ